MVVFLHMPVGQVLSFIVTTLGLCISLSLLDPVPHCLVVEAERLADVYVGATLAMEAKEFQSLLHIDFGHLVPRSGKTANFRRTDHQENRKITG
jgi:hypothetical protein